MRNDLVRVHTVDVPGGRIVYRMGGAAGAPAVMLIHAFASQSSTWLPVAQALVAAGYRVVAPDLPGHGRSSRWPHYELSVFEDALAALAEQCVPSRFDVVGHSLGGHLALRLAARCPDRVRRLVIEAAPAPPRDDADALAMQREAGRPSLMQSARRLGLGRLLRMALRREFDVKAAKPVLAELRQPMPGWWRGVASLRQVALVLSSADDGLVSARAERLTAAMPRATLVRLGQGHHLHTRHGEAFMVTVLPFLSACDRDALVPPRVATISEA